MEIKIELNKTQLLDLLQVGIPSLGDLAEKDIKIQVKCDGCLGVFAIDDNNPLYIRLSLPPNTQFRIEKIR